MPLLWFEVLRNHSLVHVLFVYRSLGVSAGIVAVALLVGPESLRAARWNGSGTVEAVDEADAVG